MVQSPILSILVFPLLILIMVSLLGYYTKNTVFNSKGDFTTAPEISTIYSEMIALFIVNHWQTIGISNQILNLIEFGPGRGTLMKNIIKTVEQVLPLKDLHLTLIEVSEKLRDQQFNQLNDLFLSFDILLEKAMQDDLETLYNEKLNIKITWYNSVESYMSHIKVSGMEKGSFMLCHEFLDALPCHKFIYKGKSWREKLIDLQKSRLSLENDFSCSNKTFDVILSEPETRNVKSILKPEHRFNGKYDIPESTEIEVNPYIEDFIGTMCPIIRSSEASMLIVDYGVEGRFTDSLFVN